MGSRPMLSQSGRPRYVRGYTRLGQVARRGCLARAGSCRKLTLEDQNDDAAYGMLRETARTVTPPCAECHDIPVW
jgi:hypothetical protein